LALEEGEVIPGAWLEDDGPQQGGVERNDKARKIPTVDYVARKGDVVIVLIQSDPPDKDQLGVVIDIDTKRYIGLPDDKPSYAIVSEVNIDTWPNAGIRSLLGRKGEFAYPRSMPGPKLSAIAQRFLQLRERKHLKSLVRHP
jgi:hypothetical protein